MQSSNMIYINNPKYIPIHWTAAPRITNICQIKCDTFFFNAKGIIPKLYTIPPPKININNIYSAAVEDTQARIYLVVDDLEKAYSLIENANL